MKIKLRKFKIKNISYLHYGTRKELFEYIAYLQKRKIK